MPPSPPLPSPAEPRRAAATLSVVLCTHGRSDYLRACLAGLAGQSRREFDVLVVDSASPPEEAAAIAALATTAGARLLRTDEPGLSRARNLGLAEATGSWVAFLDDDAVPEPGWAAALLARIATLPDRAAALGGRILPAWEAPLPGWWPPSLRGVLTIIEWEGFGEVGVDLPEGIDIYGANMAFAAAPLREVGGFAETLGRVGDRLLSGEEVEVVAMLRARGFRAFYEGAAAVRHSIQRDRLRPGWLLSRLLWQGATDVLRNRAGDDGRRRRLLGAAARLLVQAPLLLWPATSPTLLRARCGAAYNLGYLRGRFAGGSRLTMRRRALLGTAATAPLLALHPGCATAEPRSRGARPGGAPAVPIRERLAALRLGANVERWFAIVSNKHPRRLGPAWWRGFRNTGFDHVRMFIPEVGLTGDGEEVLGLFREAVAEANGAGLPVLLGLADFIKHDAQWSDRDWAALATRATP